MTAFNYDIFEPSKVARRTCQDNNVFNNRQRDSNVKIICESKTRAMFNGRS